MKNNNSQEQDLILQPTKFFLVLDRLYNRISFTFMYHIYGHTGWKYHTVLTISIDKNFKARSILDFFDELNLKDYFKSLKSIIRLNENEQEIFLELANRIENVLLGTKNYDQIFNKTASKMYVPEKDRAYQLLDLYQTIELNNKNDRSDN